MDWQKIWVALDVFIKAQNVPNTENIRKWAMEEIIAWNTERKMEPVVVQPDLPLEPSTTGDRWI